MDSTSAVKLAILIVSNMAWGMLFTPQRTLAQSKVTFKYNDPRTEQPITASDYLNDFAIRHRGQNPRCYEMGWYKFHVKQTGLIDSVQFFGDIHADLKALGEKSIRESQACWQCEDCKQTGGHWFTIPVFVAYTCSGGCSPNPIYSQSVAFYKALFKEQPKEQLPIGPQEWLLAPMYAICMK